VLGDTYVDSALAKATPFTAPLQELVTRHAWGNTWQRQGIEPRTRSIVTVSMLVALGRMHELKVHVRGALNNGVTKEELQEIFLHASVYCGLSGRGGCLPHGGRGDRRRARGHLRPHGRLARGISRAATHATRPNHSTDSPALARLRLSPSSSSSTQACADDEPRRAR
jgi:4-carboxymuconolactone decarboxylase